MRFFVDANVIVYSATVSDYRDPCQRIVEAIAVGGADGRTSTAALEEVWHAELSGRIAGLAGLTERAYTVLAPLLAVDDPAFRAALSLDLPSSLGANDRLHATTCLANGIDVIVSADADFDAVARLRRVDPLEADAVGELLEAR